ncbi:MAG: 50S ribosomal protein L11 methyltransferase [Desulfobacterales bacterium]
MAGKLGTTISAIRGCIRGEVASGRLAYCQELGATLVGKAYCFPIHLTNRILLVPPNIRKPSNPNAIQIILQSGAAFGDGRHPSTRTALFLLDRLASQPKPNEAIGNSGFSADIGTGSGILAIAAALLFPVSVMAIDNDPCARSEAKSNVALNGLEGRVAVTDSSLPVSDRSPALLMANLRYPTLVSLAPMFYACCASNAWVICSGFLREEADELSSAYHRVGFAPLELHHEGRWAGIVFSCAK